MQDSGKEKVQPELFSCVFVSKHIRGIILSVVLCISETKSSTS